MFVFPVVFMSYVDYNEALGALDVAEVSWKTGYFQYRAKLVTNAQ